LPLRALSFPRLAVFSSSGPEQPPSSWAFFLLVAQVSYIEWQWSQILWKSCFIAPRVLSFPLFGVFLPIRAASSSLSSFLGSLRALSFPRAVLPIRLSDFPALSLPCFFLVLFCSWLF
jgi:hypothetical protein